MLEIIEILSPAERGKTRPYLCRAEDDALYYVKGLVSGRRSQCCEWLVGHLALKFGLPVAPFAQVELPPKLLSETRPEWQDIGSGVAFASKKQENVTWLEPHYIKYIPEQLKRDVIAFDWWVKNMDRMHDNPNLLWAQASKQLTLIDYAFSFDDAFFPTVFQSNHIFSAEIEPVFNDLARQAEYAARFEDALSVWDQACNNLHRSWLDDADATDPAPDLIEARLLLERCLSDELWKTS